MTDALAEASVTLWIPRGPEAFSQVTPSRTGAFSGQPASPTVSSLP